MRDFGPLHVGYKSLQLSGLWETVGMKKPELIAVGWLGPRDEMDRASHRFGKCSECHEIICVERPWLIHRTRKQKPMKCSIRRLAHTLS
jgi:hypothetical protein